MNFDDLIELYERSTGAAVYNNYNGKYTVETVDYTDTMPERTFIKWLKYQLECEIEIADFIAVDDISGEELNADFLKCDAARLAAYDDENNIAYIAFDY